MPQTIQLRRGTQAEWLAANPVLAEGELGVVTDTKTYKIGDGVLAWVDLPTAQLSPEVAVLLLQAQSDPQPTESGKAAFYFRDVCGRMMPKWVGPAGLDSMAQPSFANNGIIIIGPNTTTTLSMIGAPLPTATGTRSHPVLTDASLRTSIRRWLVTSAATAGAVAYERTTSTYVMRGSQPGMGGFFFSLRFALPTILAEKTVVMALHSNTSMGAVTVPSTQLQHFTMGADSGDENLQIMHNDGVGVSTKIDLGPQFPKNDIDAVYEFMLYCAPNGGEVHWRATRLDTGAQVQGTMTNDLPTAGVGLAPQMMVTNGGIATAVQMELMRVYLESDY